jgi:hypothetical protein
LEVVDEHTHISRHMIKRNTRYDPENFVCSDCRRSKVAHKAHGLCLNCWSKRRRRKLVKYPCKICGLERTDKRGTGRDGMCVECTIRHWTACISCKRTRTQILEKRKTKINLQGLCRACVARFERKAERERCTSWSHAAASRGTKAVDNAQ